MMQRELESQPVYRDPSLRPRRARLRLAERLWRGGVLTFTGSHVESASLFGVIKKYSEKEKGGDGMMERQTRAIWDERRARKRLK